MACGACEFVCGSDLTHNDLDFLRCRDIGTNRAVFLSGMADGDKTVRCREGTLCIGQIAQLRVDAELYVNGMNLGWETIGMFDHTMEMRNLRLDSYMD